MGAADQAGQLLVWAQAHWGARGLPWRRAGESLVARVLVEGLLAQTRAEAVAAAYGPIFGGVTEAVDWLRGPERASRLAVVATLGLPKLKVAALDSLARWLDRGRGTLDVRGMPGVGPYTAGMVALLVGEEAAPVDCNVDRVGARVDPAVAPGVWVAEVLAEAVRWAPLPMLEEFPPGYVAVSAILDIGATRCALGRAPRCAGCPLAGDCAYQARGPRQLEMWR